MVPQNVPALLERLSKQVASELVARDKQLKDEGLRDPATAVDQLLDGLIERETVTPTKPQKPPVTSSAKTGDKPVPIQVRLPMSVVNKLVAKAHTTDLVEAATVASMAYIADEVDETTGVEDADVA